MTSLAPVYNAQFVAFGGDFVGRELQLTYIGQGDVHPNAASYQVIAARVSAVAAPAGSAVPEPGTPALAAAGLLSLAGFVAHRRRKA